MGIPMSTVAAVGAAAIALSLLWVLRNFVVRSPLDVLPGPPSKSILFGYTPQLIGRKCWDQWYALANAYGPASVLPGVFGNRMLHIFDPKALHSILIKDVELFPKRIAPLGDLDVFIGPGLLSTQGHQHRRQRKMLNPVFSAAHLRNMTHLFYEIAHTIEDAIGKRAGKEAVEVDVNGWMARTTLEMLGQAGLGYSFDDFNKDSSDAYAECLKMFFATLTAVPFTGLAIPSLSYMFSGEAIRALLRIFPFSMMKFHPMLDISEVMSHRSREIIAEKKGALEKGDEELKLRVGEGKDIMSILLRANATLSEAERLTDEELLAQMSTFILAGMDTTSNALSRILHLLAQNPDVQEKLRAELTEARGGPGNMGDIDYDNLVKLPYLDAVCRETLRVFPPVLAIARKVAQDTVLPLSAPIRTRDGSMIRQIAVPRGSGILVNLRASNCSKVLWGEDAWSWRPERWLEPLPKELEDARLPGVYGNLMTFSGGSRSCIGFKFSQLEMKVVLSILVTSFKFTMTDREITWNTAAVVYPSMEGSTKPEMVLKVQAIN